MGGDTAEEGEGPMRSRERWSGVAAALWLLPFTAVNAVVWRLVPCDWSQPYRRLR